MTLYTKSISDPEILNGKIKWKIFFKVAIGGTFLVLLVVFTVLAIFWGALWKVPDGKLSGWIVDFDNGLVGAEVVHGLNTVQARLPIEWTVIPAKQFPEGIFQLARSVREQETWVAVSINERTTSKLTAALTSPNGSYDGSEAVTVYAAEARNENAYRNIIAPAVKSVLSEISDHIALKVAKQVASSNLTELLATSPQTLVKPVSFQLNNLIPFDLPVASAITFVGLIYQAILAFFLVMISYVARAESGVERHVSLRSLIALRFSVSFWSFFFLSLSFSLLNLAFQVNFDRKFDHTGFLIFWMVTFLGMLASGLTLEVVLTICSEKFVGFFLVLYIIANASVCTYPLEVLPPIFKYGYAAPLYNVSHASRAILFGTKNEVRLNVAVLLGWIAVSCITLPLAQWIQFVRNRRLKDSRSNAEEESESSQEVKF